MVTHGDILRYIVEDPTLDWANAEVKTFTFEKNRGEDEGEARLVPFVDKDQVKKGGNGPTSSEMI